MIVERSSSSVSRKRSGNSVGVEQLEVDVLSESLQEVNFTTDGLYGTLSVSISIKYKK